MLSSGWVVKVASFSVEDHKRPMPGDGSWTRVARITARPFKSGRRRLLLKNKNPRMPCGPRVDCSDAGV
jgi:hypothetical protein